MFKLWLEEIDGGRPKRKEYAKKGKYYACARVNER